MKNPHDQAAAGKTPCIKSEGPCPRIPSTISGQMAHRHTLLEIANRLHSARLATYLSASGNDVRAALELYRWNLRLAASFQEILSIAEIVLRNGINDSLRTWNVARQVLWAQALTSAFPHRHGDPDGTILADRVGRLHALRNRVSHMEPLLEVNISARHTDVLHVVGSISPEARDWCAGTSRVKQVARTDPRLSAGSSEP
ncbi:MAG: hypothetical protein JWQ64_2212 [Subtercola sp.]|nr:hypothetical protein [Subtercola sp.]